MERARPDPIRVVEAAYAWQPDENTWLRSIIDTCGRYDQGAGVVGFLVRTSATKTEITSMCGTSSEQHTTAISTVLKSFAPGLARQALAPAEFVGNGAYRMLRIAKSSPDLAVGALASATRLPSMWALLSGDVRSRALVLCFPRRGKGAIDEPFPHADSRALGMAGAHVGAALRLRALAHPALDANAPETEAVVTPTGKVLHASGAATSARARQSLTRAVLASERARLRSRSMPAEEALREWTALVQGRWTILDTIERDGKRLVLARRNRMAGADLLALTEDERDVVWLAALGHSYKFIAYELGLPIGTVSGRLRRAMQKLRVKSRIELLQKLGVGTTEPSR